MSAPVTAKQAFLPLIMASSVLILAAAPGFLLDRHPAPPPQSIAQNPKPPAFHQIGRASWYGPGFQGQLTASGKRFNTHKLTAAHRSLPLGSKAEIVNLENGRTVEVTVTDRGPYVPGRVIDLSEKAAKELGMTKEGIATVAVEAPAAKQPAPPHETPATGEEVAKE